MDAGGLQGPRAAVQCSGVQDKCAVAGNGATGVVQQAVDPQLQRLVACGHQPPAGGDQVTGVHLDTLGTGAALAQVNMLTA